MKTRLFLMVSVILLIYLPKNIVHGGIKGESVDVSMLQSRFAKAEPEKMKRGTIDKPEFASPCWWRAVQEEIFESEYHVSWQKRTSLPDGKAGYQAPNRAHNLRTYFTPDGIWVMPRSSDKPEWMWGLKLTGYGRKGDIQPIKQVEPTGFGNRTDYARGDLSEWYVNDKRGLEQGFTLHVPPDSQNPASSPGVVLQVDFSGTLDSAINHSGDSIAFTTKNGMEVIRYGQLLAFDATGRMLSAQFDLNGNRVHIHVDTTRAVYPVTVDPLAISPNWTDEGGMASARFGSSVSSAGDVDGDGCDDVIVSAPWYDLGEPNMGRIYVYFGSLWGLPDTPYWTASGIGSLSVATAGDINGDGNADIIIGTGNSVYVYHGSDMGLGEGGTPSNADWTAGFGRVVGTAGDVNGDGYDDIVIGDPYYFNDESDEGAAFVYHGSGTGLGATGTPQNADWHYESNQINTHFGYSLGSAGDVNGDGYGDVIFGAPDLEDSPYEWEQGQAFVFYGSPGGLGVSPNWTAMSEVSPHADDFGFSVGSAGDVNGDGYSDVIIGEPFVIDTSREGQVFVFHGSETGLDLNGTRPVGSDYNADWHIQTGGTEGRFGWSVSTAGDVDGDRYADVIVGAPYSPNSYDRYGLVLMYRGSAAGLSESYAWWARGDLSAIPEFGSSVAAAGDVNGDGYDDVIIGEPKYSSFDEGRAFVFRGSRFVPPEVTTRNASGVTTDSATLHGRLDDLGTASPSVKVFFDWGSADVGEVLAAYNVGSRPQALAFDGDNIWVANWGGNNVMKLRASDGELLDTYGVGTAPRALAFDGANIWVAHSWYENNALRKIRASDGQLLGTYPVGNYNYDLAFDGTNIWVTNGLEDTVTKLRASDGKLLGTYDVGDYPIALAFDGTYIWVANSHSDNVMRLRANSGELVATYDVGDSPFDLVFEEGDSIFDGNIWVVNSRDDTVMKFNAHSGNLLGTYNYGNSPNSLAFDGVHIWVSDYENVMKLRASDGVLLGTYEAGEFPSALVFDGVDIWVANNYGNNVMRVKAFPYEYQTPAQTQTGDGLFSAVIDGLDPETVYHFRARAVGDWNGYGADMTFAYTPGPPVVATASATEVTSGAAILNGTIYYLGAVTSVDVSFEWGPDTNYGNETPAEIMTATGPFSKLISGLNPGNTYHFRAKAVGNGTGYGDDMTFIAQVNEVWVDDDYTSGGHNDGHAWGQDAFSTIQEGIDTVESPGLVHVAPGNYNEIIAIRSGVKVLGAGAGYDPAVHSIVDASGLWGTVVTATNVDASATLQGLTITNGYGYFVGAGMHNNQSSPRVTNCIFSGNEADESGGGMYNLNSSPTVINCIFSGNIAWGSGAGMFNIQSSPMVLNCTFSANVANSGGGMFNYLSTPTITNSILWGNSASQGNEILNVSNFPVVSYCDIQQPSDTYPGIGNINADPLFVNEATDNFHLQIASPCVDAGDPASDFSMEPNPNGDRINIGAYGGTPEATRSSYLAPVIEDIVFNSCISEQCTAAIEVTASDPSGGNLSYVWTAEDGGSIIGSGDTVDFDPPIPSLTPGCLPFRVKVAVTSDVSELTTEQTVEIIVKLAGDANGDGVVNILDKVTVRNAFGSNGENPADVNCDNVVNILDKVVIRNQFGQSGCPCP